MAETIILSKGSTKNVVVVLLLGLMGLLTWDDHRTNLRYLLWKSGFGGNWKQNLHLMVVDVPFRNSLIGLSRSEVKKFFPDRSAKNTESDGVLANYHLTDKDGEWIGKTDWFIWYKDGVVQELILIKG